MNYVYHLNYLTFTILEQTNGAYHTYHHYNNIMIVIPELFGLLTSKFDLINLREPTFNNFCINVHFQYRKSITTQVLSA